MTVSSPTYLRSLPIPPNYMRAEEQKQVREMNGPMGRPDGDHRSADTIIDRSPVLRNFLDNRDNYHLLDDLKQQVGDWTAANTDPEARANAAYDLDKVLRFIDNLDDRQLNKSHSRNGQIDGFSSNGFNTVDNSEASVLKEFSTKGYSALKSLHS
ncbi:MULTISPECIES: hypothetical protein [Pseudomonas]|uniref:Uncharacterized protein n=2 Tax=Pseudomonas palleroniana TaxID=191390 RepID=A0A1H5P317_9PSED|nr:MULTISPECIES: hypothetical protein [Pseudomonas]SEF08004.1 hypothetical protein SAMN04490198_5145 [Pseudomonas palleroniana]